MACVDEGLTNTVTAVKNAQMAESPVLLIGGAAATLLKGRGALQDIDQLALFRPLCKFCATVRRLRDIQPTITRALHIAQSGTPGTTQLHVRCTLPSPALQVPLNYACAAHCPVRHSRYDSITRALRIAQSGTPGTTQLHVHCTLPSPALQVPLNHACAEHCPVRHSRYHTITRALHIAQSGTPGTTCCRLVDAIILFIADIICLSIISLIGILF